jgi:2-aminoadipate transaminase
MSGEKRAALVELARRFAIPIVEDDAYGFLSYGASAPPMRALDDEFVLYVGSFSKILAPGFRVGWLVVPEELVPKLSIIKEGTDIDTSTFSQRCISAYLDKGQLPDHLSKLRKEYRDRRDAMLWCLEKFFTNMGRWRSPDHGFFIWVELMQAIDTAALLKAAIEVEKVAFIPGHAFSAAGGTHYANCIRFSFSNSNPGVIEDGIGRLASMLALTRNLG